MNETKTSNEAKKMTREVENTGKATFVHGSNRRHSAAVRLIATGEYVEVNVGHNLFRLVAAAQ